MVHFFVPLVYFSGQRVINIGLEVFDEHCFLVLLTIKVSKILALSLYMTVCIPSSCIVKHMIDDVLSCILKKKRCHDASEAEIASFKVCFSFIAVLPLTIGNDHLRIILLAKHIHPPFDNGNSTVRSHVDVHVVFGRQLKIVWDNPPVIHHALRLWIYKNAGLMALVFKVPVNMTTCFFIKGTQIPFLTLSLLHALCVEKIWTTWPMHHARNDHLIRLKMVYRVQNLGRYHRIIVLSDAQFEHFI